MVARLRAPLANAHHLPDHPDFSNDFAAWTVTHRIDEVFIDTVRLGQVRSNHIRKVWGAGGDRIPSVRVGIDS